MKKITALAGFFVLTSTAQSFAQVTQNTFLNSPQHYSRICDTDLKPSFLQWRTSQMQNSLTRKEAANFQSRYILRSKQDSAFHFAWWPQALQLNRRLSKTTDWTKTNPTDYPLAGLASDVYKWFGIRR